MSSDEVLGRALSLSSESSDSIGFLEDYASRISKGQGPNAAATGTGRTESSSAAATSDVEPDWVREYTPKKQTDFDRKQALLASLDEEDDDNESVINLISQDPEEVPDRSRESSQAASKNSVEEPQRLAPPKRARVAAKPKANLPLVVAPKLDDSLVLLQSVDNNMDLSGDVGAVGRVKVQDGELFLDIKGVVYRTSVNPCNSLCVVSVGEDEARVTATLDEAVVLTSERNLFASDEIVVHGELDEATGENGLFSQSEDASVDGQSKRPGNGKKRKTGNGQGKSRSKNNTTTAGTRDLKKGRITKTPFKK